jgi:hypothetical protein
MRAQSPESMTRDCRACSRVVMVVTILSHAALRAERQMYSLYERAAYDLADPEFAHRKSLKRKILCVWRYPVDVIFVVFR